MKGAGERKASSLLAAEGLRVRFGGLVALDGVDVAVRAGEIVGLVGPNGAGKSTLLDVLVGRRTPTAGAVLLEGRDVTHLTPRERAAQGIGIVTQGGRVLGHLDVAAHLALGRLAAERAQRPHTGARALDLLTEALCAAAVTPWMLARDLAHGAQQSLELATVLATRPRVLLLDEPTSGMDRDGRTRTATLLRSLHAADPALASVVVEHDPAFIRDVADRVVVLSAGNVIAEGTPQEVERSTVVREAYLGAGA